jgi:acylphosphatase
MQSKNIRSVVALAAIAALGLPAAVAAKGPGHHGRANGANQQGKGHGRKHGRALIVKGTVSAVGDGSVDVLVQGANHHGRALRGQTVTVDVSNARIVVRDVNGDGARDLGDVAVGDRVLVQSRIDKGETPDSSQPLVANRVVDKGQRASGDTAGDTGDNGDSETSPTP